MTSFAEWLKTEMGKRGLSVYALADKAGMKYQTVDGIIKNNRSPRIDTVIKIETALGVRYQPHEGMAESIEQPIEPSRSEQLESTLSLIRSLDWTPEEKLRFVRELLLAVTEDENRGGN